MLDRIHSIATNLAPRLIEIRRHLHAHPELSGKEYQTSAYIAGVLSAAGLQTQESVGKTGVIGELAGAGTDDRGVVVPLPRCGGGRPAVGMARKAAPDSPRRRTDHEAEGETLPGHPDEKRA